MLKLCMLTGSMFPPAVPCFLPLAQIQTQQPTRTRHSPMQRYPSEHRWVLSGSGDA